MTEPSDRPQAADLLPERAQVVIVGGGVIGCSIAYHLAHLGWTDVVLLEQHALTAGTTWHAAGLITSAGMTDETSLFFSRYSRDLYTRLEAETGHSTGFRAVGHISLATTPPRQEALRREAAWMHGFGVDDNEISAAELAAMWPLARTDDVLTAFYVADEGRADPVGVATSLAKGARQRGVRIIEGIAATGVATRGRRVTAVLTEAGRIETDVVVNAAGMWARQFGALAGVSVPLQAAEHYYLLTDTVPGMDPDLPVIEDPDNYGYYRPEGDGMLVGLFEPVGAPWSLDGVARNFSFGKVPPDWDRLEPFLGPALARIPCLAETGVRTFFCGPESFTADVRPLIGPAPELDGYFVAAGLNSLGILSGGGVGSVVAHWIVDGVPPVDTAQIAVDRTATYETSRRFRRERTVEQLGVLFGDAVWPAWQPSTARNIRRSVLHDRLAAQGAHFGQSAGWEFAEWFAEPGEDVKSTLDFSRQPSHEIVAREHKTVRDEVGVLDMTLMAKLIVQGPDAAAVLSRLSANDVTAGLGRIVYTQWLNEAGGIVADVTVTWLEPEKFLVIASDVIHRRIEPMIRRETRPDEFVTVTDVTSGTTLLSVQGPSSRELLRRLTDCDLTNATFPYLSARQLHVGYAPALAVRVT
jgi:heterotetrameric sarcosine oxidase gamma subunit